MKYAPINWQDGMKINRDHLVGLEYALRNEMQDQAAVNPHHYGLLATGGEASASFELSLNLESNGQILIQLTACQAVGLNGGRIELFPEQTALTLPSSLADIQTQFNQPTEIFVVLNVNPYERIKGGEIDPEENPPRYPHTFSSQILKLSPVFLAGAKSGGAFDLTLGKVLLSKQSAELDPAFVPPLTTWMAHPLTQKQYQGWLKGLIEIEGCAHQTLARLRQLSKQGSGDLIINNVDSELSSNVVSRGGEQTLPIA